ncbi:MAG: iron ABC transporter permease [Propionibacteriaceae bacterium]|nr:iron ABC transporter permease [Propionibacteriaceae bacterium]
MTAGDELAVASGTPHTEETEAPQAPTKTRRGLSRSERGISLVTLIILVVVPLAFVVVAAFITGAPLPGIGTDWSFTLEHIGVMLGSMGMWTAMWNSFVLALGSTIFGVALGVFLAWLAARTDVPMRGLVTFTAIVPLLIPGLVGAIAWTFLAAPGTGYISLLIEQLGLPVQPNIYTMGGMLFVMTLYNVSVPFILTYGALQMTNPDMEDAANVHGATSWRTMFGITLPLVKPALLSAIILTFVSTMEEFPVPMILGYSNGIETMAARIFVLTGQAPPPVNENSAQAVLLMAVVLILVIMQRRMVKNQSFASVTGKGVRHRVVKLGWFRWVGFAIAMLYVFLAVGLPLLALLMGSLRTSLFVRDFSDLMDTSKMSLAPLTRALESPALWDAVRNSTLVALAVAIVGVLVSLLIAHASSGRDTWASRLIRRLAMLPAAAPAVVMGLGFVWAYVILPVSIYGTLIILIVAIVARLIPVSSSALSDAMGGIHHELEEAAGVSGATRWQSVWWVTAPLLRTTMISTGLMLFVMATREISMSIFLYTPSNMTFAVYLYTLWSDGTWASLASMSFIFAMLTMAFVIVAQRWLTTTPTEH